jgi:uncharacterized radical SAM protein YgiQ
MIRSRSPESILNEAVRMSRRPDFRGTITDIGGPTANMYGARCRMWSSRGFCERKSCLVPEKCGKLELGYNESMKLYDSVKSIPKVKHVFIGSGFRHDLLTDKYAAKYLEKVCTEHISGQMKVAPEHAVDSVLSIMNKPPNSHYEDFLEKIEEIGKKTGKKVYLVNYFISAHPGSSLKEALALAVYLAKRRMHPEQIQDFIPLPMTLSGAIYHTGRHPFTGKRIYVPSEFRERKMQRALMQYWVPSNRPLVEESIRSLNAGHLRGLFVAAEKAGPERTVSSGKHRIKNPRRNKR